MGEQRTALILLLILCSAIVSISEIETVEAQNPIYIRDDGSIIGTDKIEKSRNVYAFTDNISNHYPIYVSKHDIVIDGCGFTLEGTGSNTGIHLYEDLKNVTIKNLTITNCYIAILSRFFAEDITISGCNIINNDVGMRFIKNSGNNIIGNNITNNSEYGIHLVNYCSYHVLVDNNISNSTFGIFFSMSRYTTLRNNSLNNNEDSLTIIVDEHPDLSTELSLFSQDIDSSNTINGKPVYYWFNQQDRIVPSDAGYVGLINCTGIRVQNLNISNHHRGIVLAFSRNSTLVDNQITNCSTGIQLWKANNNTIIGNFLDGNNFGIFFYPKSSSINVMGNTILNAEQGIELRSSNSTVFGNTIANNTYGLKTFDCYDNGIIENNFMNNKYALAIRESDNNTFFHNNFINNTKQVIDAAMNQIYLPYHLIPFSNNTWDNGSEGNYWSNYNGTDNDGDGIGDVEYFLYEPNQKDNYPLMTPFDITIIPEFPSWIILPILVVSSLVILIVRTRVRRK